MTLNPEHPVNLLETIFNHVLIAVAAVNSQHQVVYANDPALQILGIPRTTIGSHLRVEDLFRNYQRFDSSGNEIPVEQLPLMRALAGEDVPPCNIKFVLPDGRFRWLHVSNHRFSVFGLTGVLLVATDETREVELQRVAASAEKFELLSAVAGGLAHNFNNMLSIINLSALEGMQSPDAGPGTRAKLQQISVASRDAANLVKRLAQFSRTQPLQPRPISINQLVREVLALTEPLLTAKSVKVIANLNPNLPDVDADPVEMEQVILNLILNAPDAMPNGGEVTITTDACCRPPDTAVSDDHNHCVGITVSDTGSGIPEGDLDRIFEPFFTTKPNGTGLGLASAHGIVRQHGGDIKVQSVPGSGASFTVYLPPSRRKKKEVAHDGPAKAA
jgi:signal transduction histidine kinase